MGLVKTLIGAAVFSAIGYSAGVFPAPNIETCKESYSEQFKVLNGQLCEKQYTNKVNSLEGKYEEMPTTPGLATLPDLNIGYVVSEEPAFKGLVWQDATGEMGVIGKQEFLGQTSYSFQKADLTEILGQESSSLALKPELIQYQK